MLQLGLNKPLTFAVSDKNSNDKLKRWNAFIDDYDAKDMYTPGKENVCTTSFRDKRSIPSLKDLENTPPLHCSSNGQIECLHSTLARCIKMDEQIDDIVEIVMRATVEYNKTLHSVIKQKAIDIIHSASDEVKQAIKICIAKAQEDNLERCNL